MIGPRGRRERRRGVAVTRARIERASRTRLALRRPRRASRDAFTSLTRQHPSHTATRRHTLGSILRSRRARCIARRRLCASFPGTLTLSHPSLPPSLPPCRGTRRKCRRVLAGYTQTLRVGDLLDGTLPNALPASSRIHRASYKIQNPEETSFSSPHCARQRGRGAFDGDVWLRQRARARASVCQLAEIVSLGDRQTRLIPRADSTSVFVHLDEGSSRGCLALSLGSSL